MNDFVLLNTLDATFINASSSHPCESFGTALVALAHQEVIDRTRGGRWDDGCYFTAMRSVAEGFEGSQEMDSSMGIDAIYNSQNAVKLEQLLHEYFRICSRDVFDNRLVCYRIDNIDMLGSKGYYMLEAMRRYLSSPFVAVIATGDLDSYRQMVSAQTQWPYNVCENYLGKVFPLQCRVSLGE